MNKGKIIKEKLESDIFTKLSSVNRKDRITALIFGIVVFLFSFVFFGFIIALYHHPPFGEPDTTLSFLDFYK